MSTETTRILSSPLARAFSSSFFPSCSQGWIPVDPQAVPNHPAEPTILRLESTMIPLASHPAVFDNSTYPSPNEDGSLRIPNQPEEFEDQFLFPTLARGERERVTSLWYYTRDIRHDKEFLAHVQRTVDLVRDLIPCDSVIMGLVDLAYFTRLVASNCPIATMPRRDSPCSHTILQGPGSVFMLTDLKNDWRFAKSPQVKSGLGFYAGTPMSYRLSSTSSEVVFGSLCVASWQEQPPLTEQEQRTLKHFSGLLASNIVERARAIRSSDRQKMATTLAQATAQADAYNVAEVVLKAVQSTYPGARVSLQTRTNDTVNLLENRTVSYAEFVHFLWEDSAAIDEYILNSNHIPVKPGKRSVRAIAVRVTKEPHSYLVVQTSDMRHVFDDIDGSFVQSCALMMGNLLQKHKLQQAITTKTAFLRGAAHQLRTPIHAILSTCELLLSQVHSQTKPTGIISLLDPSTAQCDVDTSVSNAMSTLNLIDTSGRSLLSTVNNFLNFDRLSSVRPVTQLISLAALEQEVLDQISSITSERGLDLICDNRLPPDVQLLEGDLDLLKQCLSALLQNAADFTISGRVIFRTSIEVESECASLIFDFIDSGTGIADQDRERVFLPFEKGDPFSTRPGLGLTVASSIITTIGGTLTLVHSSNEGSHFRLTLNDPTIACQSEHVFSRLLCTGLPRTYHVLGGAEMLNTSPLAYAVRQLACIGFSPTCVNSAAVILVDRRSYPNGSEDVLKHAGEKQFVFLLCRTEADVAEVVALAVRAGVGSRVVACAEPLGRSSLWRAVKDMLDGWESPGQWKLGDPSLPSLSGIPLPSLKDLHRTWPTLNVLIVDDNRTNLDILCMNAKRRRYPYVSAMDGLQAVDTFKKCYANSLGSSTMKSVSLVLMDLQMPNLNGVEATKQIRKFETENNISPCLIYMITGQSSDTDKEVSAEAGADAFFVKPLSLKTLNDLIHLQFPK